MNRPQLDDWEKDALRNGYVGRIATVEMKLLDALALRRLMLSLGDREEIGRDARLLYKRLAANIEMGIERREK